MYTDILVATDGSTDAAAGARHAIDLAHQYGATLHIIYVIETRTGYDNAIVDPDTVRENLRSDGEQSIDRIQELVPNPVEITRVIVEGIPHEQIVTYAHEHGVDLIVMGTKGRSAFKTVLLGSATEAVLRSTSIPVLVVGTESGQSPTSPREMA